MIHNFDRSYQIANTISEAEWEAVYRRFFTNFQSMTAIPRGDTWGQRAGIDRVIVLTSGKIIKIDEKVRAVDYADILLEFQSSKEGKTPGWICKDLDCDFLAYAVIPSKRVHILPFQQLRRAWERKGEQWKKEYGIKEAPNEGYTSCSVAVPIRVLLIELVNSMNLSWGAELQEQRKTG